MSADEAKRLALAVREAVAARRDQMESEDDVPMGDLLDADYALQEAAEALADHILNDDRIVERPF